MAQSVTTTEQHTPQTQGGVERRTARPVYVPPADIYETRDALVVMCELPSVATDDVDITLERRVLTIRGRGASQQHTGYQQVYSEYSDGDYERVFTLSEDIERDRIEASATDGVLYLVL
ncbi:MAG: Hsp20/alpha crystallin family protein, partial [Alphaproteobacteria bacterium]|nr:Hsp20/alpha crystallin family protein [Alphaproteobacteria bacterium]